MKDYIETVLKPEFFSGEWTGKFELDFIDIVKKKLQYEKEFLKSPKFLRIKMPEKGIMYGMEIIS